MRNAYIRSVDEKLVYALGNKNIFITITTTSTITTTKTIAIKTATIKIQYQEKYIKQQ